MKLNGIDWEPTGTEYLYKHPDKRLYMSRIPYTHDGKRKFRTTKHAETDLRKVKRIHTTLMAETNKGDYIPPRVEKELKQLREADRLNITSDKSLEECINILEAEVTPSTAKQIKSFRKHVAPLSMYTLPIKDVKFSHLQVLRDTLQAKGLKQSTFDLIRSFITQAYKRAELFNQFQHFTAGNPFVSMLESKIPLMAYVAENAPNKMTALQTAKAIYTEIQSIDDTDVRRTVLLAFLLSKRIGEVKALKMSDINLKTKTVMITILKKKGKSKSKPQEFPLPPQVIPLLEGLKDDDYISERRNNENKPYSPVAKAVISAVTNIPLSALTGYAIHDVRSVALQVLIDDNYDETKAERVLLDHATGKVSGHYKATSLTEREAVFSHYWKLIGAVEDTSTPDKVDEVNLSEFKIKFIK